MKLRSSGIAAVFLAAALATSALMGSVAYAGPAAQSVGHHQATRSPLATINVNGPEVFPHSADYDPATGSFVVGSLKKGLITIVNRDGSVRTLVDDPSMVSFQGVRVDRARNRVLVTNVDLGVADTTNAAGPLKVAGLASYDLRTGKRQWYADLAATAHDGGAHLAADVVVDSCGTAYVADTQSSNLYRVTHDGKASVLLNSPLLAGNPDVSVPGVLLSPAATSLVLVRDNLLIVSKADGSLVRVPVDHPKQAARVQLNTNLVPLAASLRGLPDGSIAAVSSGLLSGKDAVVQRIRFDHSWRSAKVTVTDTVPDPVTSGIAAGPRGATYTVSGGLADLLQKKPNSGFVLREVHTR
ncbi:hypothetical protein [Amycolatopsis sp. NPDC051061]|uniref:hypothetical protein n=1 Tax=Amycolatopsis sp. NPDC051061 TaxID=3155042 RepID=UPI00341CD35B